MMKNAYAALTASMCWLMPLVTTKQLAISGYIVDTSRYHFPLASHNNAAISILLFMASQQIKWLNFPPRIKQPYWDNTYVKLKGYATKKEAYIKIYKRHWTKQSSEIWSIDFSVTTWHISNPFFSSNVYCKVQTITLRGQMDGETIKNHKPCFNIKTVFPCMGSTLWR